MKVIYFSWNITIYLVHKLLKFISLLRNPFTYQIKLTPYR